MARRSNLSSELRVERLEDRDVPVIITGPGFPAPLAVSGAVNGAATIYNPVLQSGQYNPNDPNLFNAFPGFAGPVRAAYGDVNGDTFQDMIVVTGPGGPVRFAVINGVDFASFLVNPTDPFGDPNFTGGAFVAAGDIDRDGRADFAFTPDQGGGPRVVVFSFLGNTAVLRRNFFGINDPNFRGGARVGIGDINADGFADVAVAAGFGGGPRVSIYSGITLFVGTGTPQNLIPDFFAFTGTDVQNLRNGAYIAVGDVNFDGFADLVFGGGPGGAPRVFAISGFLVAQNNVAAAQAVPLANFFFGDPNSRGGVRVAAKTAGLGSKANIIAGTGENILSNVRVYFGPLGPNGTEPTQFQEFNPFNRVLADGIYVG